MGSKPTNTVFFFSNGQENVLLVLPPYEWNLKGMPVKFPSLPNLSGYLFMRYFLQHFLDIAWR